MKKNIALMLAAALLGGLFTWLATGGRKGAAPVPAADSAAGRTT